MNPVFSRKEKKKERKKKLEALYSGIGGLPSVGDPVHNFGF